MDKTLDARHRPRPALLSHAFRPFFLLGALYAAVAAGIWVPWFLGLLAVPSAFPPSAWYAHESLFGLMPAVIAGALLTGVPGRAGGRPIAGWPLAALVLLWLAGRAGIAGSAVLGAGMTAALALIFPFVLSAVAVHGAAVARDRHSYLIAVVLIGLAAAATLFHYEIWQFGRPKLSHNIGVALIVLLLMLVADCIGRAFTGSSLKEHRLLQSPDPFDIIVISLSGMSLLLWIGLPRVAGAPWGPPVTGALLLLAAALNAVRQARWMARAASAATRPAILHVAYAFVALGFLLAGLGMLWGDVDHTAAAIHAWTVGAAGVTMLALMAWLSGAHTGREPTASAGTIALYVLVVLAALARVGAALWPEWTLLLLPVSGLAWVLAFGGFLLLYGRMLMSRT